MTTGVPASSPTSPLGGSESRSGRFNSSADEAFSVGQLLNLDDTAAAGQVRDP
jgi:hypothetical protein